MDQTLFFRRLVEIPSEYQGRSMELSLDFGGEGVVYLNGKIKCGLSSLQNNRVWLAPEETERGSLDVMLEIGVPYHSAPECYQIQDARLLAVNRKVEDFYYDLLFTYDVMDAAGGNYFRRIARHLPDVPPEYFKLIQDWQSNPTMHDRLLEIIKKVLPLVKMEGERAQFIESVEQASELLWREIGEINASVPFDFAVTGASHIDTAWLWPLRETIRKCSRTFSNTLDLMDEYPEHIYSQSQPQLYEYTKQYYPELFERIRQKVQEGRWELVGNPWVECDTNIPSGESLVRQFLYGRKFYRKEFGKESNIFWMPDVFGYSWSIPQIMKRSGVDYFITTKLICNDTNDFPYSVFEWQGVDGTRVLAHLSRENYNGLINPWYFHYLWKHFTEKGQFDEVLDTYGYGDGGGGPVNDMLEYARRANQFPGVPKMKFKPAKQFFEELEQKAAKATVLPVWNDEMYFELHRGTYTTQAEMKKNNRKSELLYRRAEMAASVEMALFQGQYPANCLEEGWKLILLNQFHDILPGSSIDLVYQDAAKDYEKVTAIGNNVLDKALGSIAANITGRQGADNFAVFNFLSFERNGQVKLEIPDFDKDSRKRLLDSEGKEISYWTEEDGRIAFEAEHIPAMGYRVYSFVEGEPSGAKNGITVTESGMENRYFRLILDDKGCIASLYDKEHDFEVIPEGECGNRLVLFEDSENAWDIVETVYQDHCYDAELVSVTPGNRRLHLVRKFQNSVIRQDIVLYEHTPRIDFVTEVDWQEDKRLLKAAFPVNVYAPRATYEIAYGAIERPTHSNTSWDQAKFEVPAHKWADLSDNGRGVALMNDCKYGYDIKENRMRLTLLRATSSPGVTGDRGKHAFTYSLYPHSGSWQRGHVVERASELNVPLEVVGIPGTAAILPMANSFLSVNCNNVLIDTVKKSEEGDALIIRVYESCGQRGNAEIHFGFPVYQVAECNLMEVVEQPCPLENGVLRFFIKPFEIKTFRIMWRREADAE